MIRQRRDLSNLTGQFHNWTIVRRVDTNDNRQRTHYLCRCKCNTERVIKAVNLVNGSTKSCGRKGCKTVYRSGVALGDLTASIWSHIKRNASVRRISFTVTQEYAWQLFQQQKGLCALTGAPMHLGSVPGRSTTASLDRIDSSLPYEPGNVQWVLKEINMMKRDVPIERFVELCRQVIACQP